MINLGCVVAVVWICGRTTVFEFHNEAVLNGRKTIY